MQIDKLIADAGAALTNLRREMEKVRHMPLDQEELLRALDGLAEAEEMARENFRRWPRYSDDGVTKVEPDPFDQSEECRAHWSECCRTKDKAVASLTALARTRRELAGIP